MPDIKLTSFGAAEEVTGSCHLLEIDDYKLLIDCGLWQGDQENYAKNWQNFIFDPRHIDAVILTHAHLDHCGRLPKLYAAGYRGKIYATSPTIQLAEIVLDDSFFIMKQKSWRQHLPKLYDTNDLNKVKNNWFPVDYYQKINLNNTINFTIHNAGHILGAGIIVIRIGDKTIVFSGDIGGENMPLVKSIDYIPEADYVITESTYGNRHHEDIKKRDEKLLQAVKRVTINNSTLLITVFAVERTQDILKILNDYYEKHLDFRVPVFLDSPMAYQATKIYQEHLNCLNDAAQATLKYDKDIFFFPHLNISNSVKQSKKINSIPPPKIILAGSGMLEGGRMIHHLAHYLPNKNNHILFVGYQVPGTLGYKIINGAFNFNYYQKSIAIKAAVDQIDGFSSHADQEMLLKWLSGFKNKPKILLVHGDKQILQSFSQIITEKLSYKNKVLQFNKTLVLS